MEGLETKEEKKRERRKELKGAASSKQPAAKKEPAATNEAWVNKVESLLATVAVQKVVKSAISQSPRRLGHQLTSFSPSLVEITPHVPGTTLPSQLSPT